MNGKATKVVIEDTDTLPCCAYPDSERELLVLGLSVGSERRYRSISFLQQSTSHVSCPRSEQTSTNL